MSLLRLSRELTFRAAECRCYSLVVSTRENEYTRVPQYPPITDLSREKIQAKKNEEQYEELKSVKTVEEKQIKLNMSKYYGFKCYTLRENYVPYNNLHLAQHVTKTHLIKTAELPEFYRTIDVKVNFDALKLLIEESLLLECDDYHRIYDIKKEELHEVEKENILSLAVSKQINRILLNNLNQSYPHLNAVQVDLNPRIESFWLAGGMNPPENIKKCRTGTKWQKDIIDEPINRVMNYIGTANVALRFEQPLLPIVSFAEAENPDLNVPFFKLDPRTAGTKTDYRHIANVPGFWPGDPKEFAFLSYHQRGHILTRPYDDAADNQEALHRQGILASFGWLNAQANFLGFNTFNDVTYPLVTQLIITNGKMWSFYVYQLNTIINHSKYVKENPKRNLCWATPELKLFEEIKDGKVIGFNDEVLKNLIYFYVNAPKSRLGVNLKPYLSQEEKVCAHYKDDEKREWLEREYKYIVANRPRHILPFELYAWEKIYKIDNKTRFMDKKIRPFELGIKPFNRKLDDRKPRYIPRAARPNLPRQKGRDANEYFP